MSRSFAIEGIIGAGKTTLLRTLEKECQIQAVHEPVDDNPFLELFYADQKRYAFTMQMWLLARRHAANKSAYWLARAGMNVVVDRGRLGDRCFARVNAARGNMTDHELGVYEQFFRSMDARDPDVIIFIDIGVSEAIRRIKARNRECEKAIDPNYLHMLRVEHDHMTHKARERGVEVMRIDDDYDVDYIARVLKIPRRGA